ncbi:uncharacterized protein sS8_0293 [Methylocaldum marinum]|uniref:DUF2760 domain-containing protein n=1 Tax=Methylocaldum marinum TaxID=1432792 RepID=A0A286P3N9_9GAMM|nr:DUF2760 domain-containing protein [Methylocaldum marinum]BBA32261.1 uncharacterized protein sS8_0293 [Methylocaldum marinum]
MQFDPTLIPTTFDAVHIGLAALAVVLLILQILLLSVAVIALLRRGKPAAEPIAVQVRPEPAATPVREAAKSAELVKPERPEPVVVKQATPDAALQLLGLLQKEARFVDFVQENVAAYSDAEIGAAARVVHEGCRKVLSQNFELEPVRKEQENSRVTLPKGFDASSVRPTGNIVGEPPFTGTLIHRGWRAAAVRLPKIAEGHDVRIIAQAEVEL